MQRNQNACSKKIENEKLDYFDPDDNYLGTLPRKEVHRRKLINRHVAFYITNSRKELLLQLRAKCKRVNPNQWDKPGGHVSAGESYEKASRELLEEVCYGIDDIKIELIELDGFESKCKSSDLHKTIVIAELDYRKNYPARRVLKDGFEEIEVIHLKSFKGIYDGPTKPQPSEVQKLGWYSRGELEHRLFQDPMSLGNDLKDALERFGDKIFSPRPATSRASSKQL